ncbi:endoglucanase 12 [Malania oleifera]|uniref:endoglucanase 12 n=1 Tax=Malania oleifera TaxID=397392 RepID=UPI0025AE6D86|nr:endoglucanase 12 [Malania oleifera]
MHSGNHWGGSFEIVNGGETASAGEEERSRNMSDWDRGSLSFHRRQQEQDPDNPGNHHHHQELDETQQSWLLGPPERKKKKYVDLGCIMCSQKALKWTAWSIVAVFFVVALPIIITKCLPKHHPRPPVPDNYTVALHKALLFFNAQKSGKLPKNNGIGWRGNSGLRDGSDVPEVKGGLVGGYYDAGDNTKYHFPMAFTMTMLSWSVIEYSHKYQAIGEYDHVLDLIKWGADYLLLTFNSSAPKINKVFSQVGGSPNRTATPNDYYCWERPEDMDYKRPTQTATSGPDLAGEMAAALAAASIVFRDNLAYATKLRKGAATVFAFARDFGRRTPYSRGNLYIEPFYNSTGYFDEYMWGAAWLYYATGNRSYIQLATNPGVPRNAKAFVMTPQRSVLSWDNKLPAAMLLLTRLRIFLNPGYPYEDMLRSYHNVTGLNMCSYLRQFNVFNWTRGGLIRLSQDKEKPLQYVANAAFLASLFADYMNATGIPGWNCGPKFIPSHVLRSFATSQMDYILGANPMKMSYVVGYGNNFPRKVHHRAASIPSDKKKYSCTGGYRWRDSKKSNPHNITGAMVGGPDAFDRFQDSRNKPRYNEPTLAGNAGLVAALVSLTASGGTTIDRNSIFSGVPPLYPPSPPPPSPWKP